MRHGIRRIEYDSSQSPSRATMKPKLLLLNVAAPAAKPAATASCRVGAIASLTSNHLAKEQKIVHRCALSDVHEKGTFFAPTLVEIDDVSALTEEQFGPILHVVKFKSRHLDKTVAAINDTGFGLTMGLHSRIDSRIAGVAADCRAGNLYVNRNMIGAVVGVQPFGGRGLSGTGPKAGGPNYVQRFGTEFTLSNNISAVGGNASLLTLGSD